MAARKGSSFVIRQKRSERLGVSCRRRSACRRAHQIAVPAEPAQDVHRISLVIIQGVRRTPSAVDVAPDQGRAQDRKRRVMAGVMMILANSLASMVWNVCVHLRTDRPRGCDRRTGAAGRAARPSRQSPPSMCRPLITLKIMRRSPPFRPHRVAAEGHAGPIRTARRRVLERTARWSRSSPSMKAGSDRRQSGARK